MSGPHVAVGFWLTSRYDIAISINVLFLGKCEIILSAFALIFLCTSIAKSINKILTAIFEMNVVINLWADHDF